MMPFIIRNATPNDVEDIERLEKLCFSLPWTKEQILSQLPDDEHIFLAADDGGGVAGYVGAMLAGGQGYISNVAADPEKRRQGVGDRLISQLVDTAKKLELEFLTLEVRASNAPAIALYAKHGFSPVGVRKNYYEKPREDAILMSLFF